jgi:glycosyltransferase involved in cell wall biosynthesis
MPAYNAERTLAEAIESILAQEFRDFELIVVDDASSDSMATILKRYARLDTRIVVLTNSPNQGISRSRNRALWAARGEYVACLDSDDVAEPSRLGKQLEHMRNNPDCVLLGSDLTIINEASAIVGRRVYPHTDHELRKAMPRFNPFAQPASMFRSELARNVGGFRDDLPLCEDYDFFFRMAEQGKVSNLAQPLTRYRVSSTQSKTRRLHETVRHTLLVQNWAFDRGWKRSVNDTIYRLLLRSLLLFPQTVVLHLFKWLTYRLTRSVARTD